MAEIKDKRNIVERIFNLNPNKIQVNTPQIQVEAVDNKANINMVIGNVDTTQKVVLNTIDATQLDERQLFDLFRKMDTDSVISAALDLFADTATKINPKTGKVVYVESPDASFQEEINRFLQKQVKIDNEARGIVRKVLKYGKVFIDTGNPDDEEWVFLPLDNPEYIQALTKGHDKINYFASQLVSDEKKEDNLFARYAVNKKALEFEVVEPSRYIAGFNGRTHKGEMVVQVESAITGEVKEEVFKIRTGRSILEPIISTWQTLATLEDSLFVSRLVKSTAFNIVQIDVSGTNNTQRTQMIQEVKAAFRSAETLDQTADRYQNRQSPIPIQDFVYVPVQGERGSVTVSKVGGEIGEVDLTDIEYYNNKKFAGLGVLKAFLGWEETTPSGLGESPLTRLDERFSNRVSQVQGVFKQVIESEIEYYWTHSRAGRTIHNIPEFEVVLGRISTKEDEVNRASLRDNLSIANDIVSLSLGDFSEFVSKEKLFFYVFDKVLGIDVRTIDNTPIPEDVKIKVKTLKESIEKLSEEGTFLEEVSTMLETEEKGEVTKTSIISKKVNKLKNKSKNERQHEYKEVKDLLEDWDIYVEFKNKKPVLIQDLLESPTYKRVFNEHTYKQLKQKVKQLDPERLKKSKKIVVRYTGIDKHNYLTFTMTAEDPEKNKEEGRPTSYNGRVNLKQLLDIIKEADGSIKDADIVRKAVAGDIEVDCTCPAAMYWGQQYMGTKQGYSIVKNDIEPKKNLPTQVVCKHTMAMLTVLPAWWNTITRDLKAKGILKVKEKEEKPKEKEEEVR